MNGDTGRRLAAARVDLVEAAGRCAEFGAELEPDRVPEFGVGVAAALKALDAAITPGGDVDEVEAAARGLAKAVTSSVKDLGSRGLDDPGLAFIGAVLTLRAKLLAVDSAALDHEKGSRR